MSELGELKNKHLGETAWVLGSGATLEFIKPDFFTDKLVVTTNFSARATGIKSQYAFTHYHSAAAELASLCDYVVTLRRDTITRNDWSGEIPDNIILINQDSYIGPGSSWNPFTTHAPKPNSLVYGSSGLHGAMHLAAWLGASSIVLVGADCGTLDGETNVSNYAKDNGAYPFDLYNRDHKQMKDWLAQEYDVAVYSLNPFINLNLEGHKFQGV